MNPPLTVFLNVVENGPVPVLISTVVVVPTHSEPVPLFAVTVI